jgi:hypothetical protein
MTAKTTKRPTLSVEKLKTLTTQDTQLPHGGSGCRGTGGDGAGGGLKQY